MQDSRKSIIFAPAMSTRREKNKPKPTLNKQLEQPEVREKEKNEVASKMGDFCLDVAKLVIGGVLLAGLMNQDIEYWPLALSGLVAVLVFVVSGIYLIRKSNKK